jgi:uncharacterized protein YdbL (DUF1318 family)
MALPCGWKATTSRILRLPTPGEVPNAIFCGTAAVLLAGCAAPAVKLVTPEPIAVDINMRVDVYQHNETPSGQKPATAQPGQNPAASTPESRRRNRMADIQEFKNSRLVGEGIDGLLVVIEPPPGDYGQFVIRTVAEENADRMEVMRAVAERTKRPLPTVQADQAAEWRRRSFSGEWIQVPGENEGDPPVWQQKAGS